MGQITTRRLYHISPRTVEWKTEEVDNPTGESVLIQTLYSAISTGTELLFFRGDFHPDLPLDSQIRELSGQPQYPFRYGYCLCGRIVDVTPGVSKEFVGKNVFVFRPHESLFWSGLEEIQLIPEDVPLPRALFFPNLETAVNLVLDVCPKLGERISVFGQGVVGLLTTHLLSRFPLESIVTFEPSEDRRTKSVEWGAHRSLSKLEKTEEETFDAAIELSGNPKALDEALRSVGFSGRVLVGSWYGKNHATLDLGGAIHRSRIQLQLSQVSTISPELTGRWNRERRTRWTWQLLRDLNVEALISHTLSSDRIQNAFELLDRKLEPTMKVAIRYE